jgi:hypothetical protein
MVYTRRRDLWDLAQAKEWRGPHGGLECCGEKESWGGFGAAEGDIKRQECSILRCCAVALLLGEARQAQTCTADRHRVCRNRFSRRGYFNVALAREGFR